MIRRKKVALLDVALISVSLANTHYLVRLKR